MELRRQAGHSIACNLCRNKEWGQHGHFMILTAYILTKDNIHLTQKYNHQGSVLEWLDLQTREWDRLEDRRTAPESHHRVQRLP
jgi:hypothetical protein